MKISIARSGIPATQLFVEVIKETTTRQMARPIAFILPGGPGADHTSYLQYQCLLAVCDLVFHDPRGCGQSDEGSLATYTMDNYIDDVETIRHALALDKIIVIGKSYGSMCALGYAIRYPQAVHKLILAAGAPSYHFLETAKDNIKRLGSAAQIAACEKLWAGNFKNRDEVQNFVGIMNPLYSYQAKHREIKNDQNNQTIEFAVSVLNQGFKHSFWHFDYEKQLNKIVCPSLVLAGREDWINDVKYAEIMAERIPDSKLMVFAKAGHSMEVDVREEYFQTIADFICLP